MFTPVLTGALAAIIIIAVGYKCLPRNQLIFWGIALIIAALIYVGFNLYDQAWELLPIELLGVVIYGGLALLAWKHHPIWLALGWLLHVVWDLGVHPLEGSNYVPHWYPAACLGFDLVVAVYLLGTEKK